MYRVFHHFDIFMKAENGCMWKNPDIRSHTDYMYHGYIWQLNISQQKAKNYFNRTDIWQCVAAKYTIWKILSNHIVEKVMYCNAFIKFLPSIVIKLYQGHRNWGDSGSKCYFISLRLCSGLAQLCWRDFIPLILRDLISLC